MQAQQQTGVGNLTIQEKIELAHNLFDTFSGDLRSEPAVGRLLSCLEDKIDSSRRIMWDLGVVAACKHCEEQEGGSCCGAGIEDRYSVTLLLINLLLAVPLVNSLCRPGSCYFLGKEGCILPARHVICVNYLCTGIRYNLSREQLLRLQEITGEEMTTGFVLHETIRKVLRSRTQKL